MLLEVIPHVAAVEGKDLSAVSACCHLGDFYSLCIPLKNKTDSLKVKRSFKKTGDKLFRIFKASDAITRIRLTFKKGN